MPAKNAAPYLQECIDSILDQTETNWELIVVNDHSSDDTGKILRQYAQEDHRIKVLNNAGTGIINALQTGYQLASGNLITRMDADDKMPSNKLTLMKEAAIHHGPKTVITGLVKYFSDKELGNGYLEYQDWLNRLTSSSNNYSEIYKECVIASPCWMMWKDDFEEIGGFNSNTYPEDYDLTFRMYQYQMKVIGVPEILHFWRDYQERTSRNDINYKDNRFLELKTNYFLKLNYKKHQQLVLWGAGKKGKKIASILVNEGVQFRWICNTTNKIGHMIHQVQLEDSDTFDFKDQQVIVAVAGKEDQRRIDKQLCTLGIEYYYFC